MLRSGYLVPGRGASGRRRAVTIAAVACAAAVLSGVRVPAASTPVAPPPQEAAAVAQAGALPSFDLSYLPDGVTNVAAFRPAETIRLAGETGYQVKLLDAMLAAMFRPIAENVDEHPLPSVGDLEQVVIGEGCGVKLDEKEGGSSIELGAYPSAVCLRTANGFPWNKRLAKWFPKAEQVTVGDRTYTRVKNVLPFATEPGGPDFVALYVADHRTLVMCPDETKMKSILNRLKTGGAAPKPRGWETVQRDFVAFVWSPSDVVTVKQPARPDAENNNPLRKAFDVTSSVSSVVLGVTVGDRSGFRATLYCKSEADAGKVEKDLERLLGDVRRDYAGPGPDRKGGRDKVASTQSVNEFVAALFDGATIDRTGSTVRVRAERTGNLVRLALDEATTPAGTDAKQDKK